MKKYWTSEIYGFGKWIRQYGFYPKLLPLCIYIDHGISLNEQPAKHELESDAPVFLFNWDIKVKTFKKQNSKPCFTLYSPFIFARKSLKIEQREDAQGSIFFLGHSTQNVVDQRSVEEYHRQLSEIPEMFKPLTICLHIHDINRGLDKKFQKLGYKVVSAGDNSDENFTERFYNILSKYKYAISNMIGSHVFYSIEMGIPFGLYGTEPNYLNDGDPNIETGEYISYKELNRYQQAISLFSSLPKEITHEQRVFVEEHLGIKNGLNRIETAIVLYKAFVLWVLDLENRRELSKSAFRFLENYTKSLINKTLDFSLRKLLIKFGIKNIGQPRATLLQQDEIAGFILQSDYKKIKELPRYFPTKVQFLGHQLNIVDNMSFLEMTNELFVKDIYDFNTNNNTPYIVDCGANIGLSVIYFKRLYPKSQIVAIEADPNIYQILTQNIETYGFDNVQCINSAVWINSESLKFSVEGSWGGYLSEETTETKNISVKALDLRNLINKKIDFLKIDIEGAETEVLIHAQDLIVKYVENLFFEWHSLTNEVQKLGEILNYFENNGFRYHIKEATSRETPFTNKPVTRMDSQLDCFLYKI